MTNRRLFFKTLAAAYVATWADLVVGPVAVVMKPQQVGVSTLRYEDLEAAYQACSQGADEPKFFYCSRETLDKFKVFSTRIDASSFFFKDAQVLVDDNL